MSAIALPAASGLATERRVSRRGVWWALLVAVLLGHAMATLWLQENLVGWGDGDKAMPSRIEVAFVQTLAPAAAPPAPGPALRAAGKPAKARAVVPAASAAVAEALPAVVETPVPAESLAAREVPPPAATEASAPVLTAEAASAPIAAPLAAASAPVATLAAFEWPPSTRLSYGLTGNYRGEVHGSARVQWVRQASRYQVHLDIAIGPSFAPLISRRMTSDGTLDEQGLVPGRYDEATRLPFQQPRRATVLFTPEQVTLANGSQQETMPGIQDAASQFVQLTWLFTTRPELLRAGNTVQKFSPMRLPISKPLPIKKR